MALTLTHPFVSAKPDGADATKVQPSNWNAAHSLSGAAIGDLLVASSASVLGVIAAVASGKVLVSSGVSAMPAWNASPSLLGITLTGLSALTTAAESWIGPSSTTGIYFKGGNVGIGTATPGAPLELRGNSGLLVSGPDNRFLSLQISGSANSSEIQIASSYTGGSYWPLNFIVGGAGVLFLNTDGKVGIGTQVPDSLLSLAATGVAGWLGRSGMSSPANGQWNLTNNAISAGIGLDVATDTVLKIRTRAQSGYATVDALGYKVSGTAGASFGPSAVLSITVVNGLVTAAS